MTELITQLAIIESCKVHFTGWGVKLDHRHQAGLPDILMSVPGIGTAFVETKMVGPNGIVLISPIQSVTIEKMQKAGIPCCVLAIRQISRGAYDLFVTTNSRKTKVDKTFFELHKLVGKPWPIVSIIKIANGEHGE